MARVTTRAMQLDRAASLCKCVPEHTEHGGRARVNTLVLNKSRSYVYMKLAYLSYYYILWYYALRKLFKYHS